MSCITWPNTPKWSPKKFLRKTSTFLFVDNTVILFLAYCILLRGSFVFWWLSMPDLQQLLRSFIFFLLQIWAKDVRSLTTQNTKCSYTCVNFKIKMIINTSRKRLPNFKALSLLRDDVFGFGVLKLTKYEQLGKQTETTLKCKEMMVNFW